MLKNWLRIWFYHENIEYLMLHTRSYHNFNKSDVFYPAGTCVCEQYIRSLSPISMILSTHQHFLASLGPNTHLEAFWHAISARNACFYLLEKEFVDILSYTFLYFTCINLMFLTRIVHFLRLGWICALSSFY